MRRHPGTFIAGILFIVLGLVYLADALEVLQVQALRLWPLALVVIGLAVIFSGRGGEPAPTADEASEGEPEPAEGEPEPEEAGEPGEDDGGGEVAAD